MNPGLSCCLLTRLCCGIGVITDVVSRLASHNLGLGTWSSLRSCAPGTDNDYGIREIRKAYNNIHGGKGGKLKNKFSVSKPPEGRHPSCQSRQELAESALTIS